MAVIIGFGTIVGGDFAGTCATSVQWGYSPNAQRLYCLGSPTARYIVSKPTETFSVTIYSQTGGPGSTSVGQSTTCEDLATFVATVTPGFCAGDETIDGPDGAAPWVLVNYSYNKDDPAMPGQETWGLQRWVADPNANGTDYLSVTPDSYMRGVSEGQSTNLAISGITLATEGRTTGRTGSVSAGATGTAEETTTGVVEAVGGSLNAEGETGSGSASIPITPMYF